MRHTWGHIQLRLKANLGSDSIFTYHHVFCTAGLIIWQFMQSSCTLPFKHLMPMMWLPLKPIPLFFFSPSFPPALLKQLPGSSRRMEKLSTSLVCRENSLSKPQYPLMQIAIRKDRIVLLFDLLQIYPFDS